MDGIQDVKLNFDTSDAEHALSNFSKKLIKTFDEVNIDPLAQLDEDIKKAEDYIDELNEKLKGLKPIEFEANTDEVDAQVVKLEQEYAELVERNKALSAKMSFGGATRELEGDLAEVVDRMIEIEEELERLDALPKDHVFIPVEEQEEYAQLNAKIREQTELLEKLKKVKEDGGKVDKKNNAISKLGFGRILKYAFGIRSLYTVFSKLKSAAKEGLQSVSKFSPELKSSLDGISSSFNQMKAAAGAAVAPLINAVAPIISQLAQLFTNAANAVARFFAALTGKKTVIQATANQKAFNKQLKESNNQLADFDDLNVLDKGGGADDAASVAGQFEEVPIEESWLTRVGQWIRENLPLILTIAGAFAAFEIAPKFIKNLDKISKIFEIIKSKLKTLLGITLVVVGAWKFIEAFIEAWQNGISGDNVEQLLLSLTALAVGLGILFGPTIAAIGALVGGIALLVLGIREWIKTGEASKEVLAIILGGITAIGIALSILTGGWIPLLIAGIVALVTFIIARWNQIKEVLSTVWTWIKQKVINPVISGLNWFLQKIADIINFIIDMINSLQFDIPDWIPLIGGNHVGLNLQHVTATQIPLLATGAVLPPNKPFLAMLGDQKQGTNIEAPLDTIIDAMQQALANMNYSNNQEIVLNIDGSALARITVPNNLRELNRKGYNVKVLEKK